MKLQISYRHLSSNPKLTKKIKDKVNHLKKYFNGKLDVRWVCSTAGSLHYSDVGVHGANYFFHSHASSDDLYKTLDLALAKIETQMRRKQKKLKDRLQKRRHKLPLF